LEHDPRDQVRGRPRIKFGASFFGIIRLACHLAERMPSSIKAWLRSISTANFSQVSERSNRVRLSSGALESFANSIQRQAFRRYCFGSLAIATSSGFDFFGSRAP